MVLVIISHCFIDIEQSVFFYFLPTLSSSVYYFKMLILSRLTDRHDVPQTPVVKFRRAAWWFLTPVVKCRRAAW